MNNVPIEEYSIVLGILWDKTLQQQIIQFTLPAY